MAVRPEGTPCWADVMSPDAGGAKRFYGGVLGWTFVEVPSEDGYYIEAYADGKAVAAVVPPAPGQEDRSQWCLYLASGDAVATAGRIRDSGGRVLMEPVQADDLGALCLARDPGGVLFGVWQAGRHEGFQATAGPGAYCWAEVLTREPEKSDAFFPAVFPYRAKRREDAETDFRVFGLGDRSVLGRMRMTEDFPPGTSPCINVYFTVTDCDAAVARAVELGGVLRFGPLDTPFGRFATLGDPQGADFSVIDTTTARGEGPTLTDVP
ncbi:Putative glyoxylase CFP32 [Streptomyces sp. enrichment culture]|uniref:VOC family protein n=1 Tax=Streptomyces sp. enrichment culture TaxID=1795815 RepID=UPI003F5683D6